MAPQVWRLYVDETGRFTQPVDTVAVAGLLVPAGLRGATPGALVQSLRAAVPGIPWPLHASLINQPAYFAVVHAAGAVDPSGASASYLHAAIACMSTGAPDRFGRALDAVRRSQEPRVTDIVDLSSVLKKGASDSYAHFQVNSSIWRAVRRIVGELRRRADRGTEPVLLAASEGLNGNAAGGPRPTPEDNRYFALLALLAARVAIVLESRGVPFVLEPHVLTRPITDVDSGRHRLLNAADVAATVDPAFEGSVWCEGLSCHVHHFDRHVIPLLVLADFAANACRPELDGPNRRLSSVEHSIEHRAGVPVRLTGPPPATLLAATIDAAGATTAIKRWAREQAAEWAIV